MTDRMKKLLQHAADLDKQDGATRRREEVVRRALDAGYPLEYADQLYDVAVEEHLDPAAAIELVICGVGVLDLGEPSADEWEETQVAAPPTWITNTSPTSDEAARERHLRTSFRRLRGILEHAPSIHDGISEFLHQPDVGDVDY